MTPNVKKFLMTLAATTVSIILTFGTTAIIDRRKERADKREMVLMMKVTEEDLDVFSLQQQKLVEATRGDVASDVSKATLQAQERKARWQKAREEGLIK